MKTRYLYRFLLAPIIFGVTATLLFAKPVDCREKTIDYLDEKIVFCLSKSSLVKYHEAAEVLDLEAMNELVFSGKCNFIPDGEYLPLNHYTYHSVDSVSFVAIKIEDITIWSLEELVSKEGPGRYGTGGGKGFAATLADTGFSTGHCP